MSLLNTLLLPPPHCKQDSLIFCGSEEQEDGLDTGEEKLKEHFNSEELWGSTRGSDCVSKHELQISLEPWNTSGLNLELHRRSHGLSDRTRAQGDTCTLSSSAPVRTDLIQVLCH